MQLVPNHRHDCHERAGIVNNGIGNDGIGNDGIGNDGIGNDGIGNDGIGNNGTGNKGIGNDGIGSQGICNDEHMMPIVQTKLEARILPLPDAKDTEDPALMSSAVCMSVISKSVPDLTAKALERLP